MRHALDGALSAAENRTIHGAGLSSRCGRSHRGRGMAAPASCRRRRGDRGWAAGRVLRPDVPRCREHRARDRQFRHEQRPHHPRRPHPHLLP
jgi:hypothetical protein